MCLLSLWGRNIVTSEGRVTVEGREGQKQDSVMIFWTSDSVRWQMAKGLMGINRRASCQGVKITELFVPVLQLITLWPQASLLAVRASLGFSFLICNVRTTNSIFKGAWRSLPSPNSTPGLLSGEGGWRREGGQAGVFGSQCLPMPVSLQLLVTPLY